MERKGAMSRKQGKGRGHHPPTDLIALGSKARPGADVDKLRGTDPTRKLYPTPAPTGIKRESPSGPSGSGLAKRPKLGGPQSVTPLGRPIDIDRKPSPGPQTHQYDEIAKEVDPADLMDALLAADAKNNDDKVERLMCGAVKYLKANRAKPESAMYLTLLLVAKSKSSLFNTDLVIEAFCSMLKRDMSLNFKSKGNPLVSVLTCNVLMGAFCEEKHWPDHFVKVFLEDALGERIWVDRSDCKSFVDNIQTAFRTKLPRSTMLMDQTRTDQSASAGSSPIHHLFGDEDKPLEIFEGMEKSLSDLDSPGVMPRYSFQQVSIEMHVLDVLREQLNRRQSIDGGSRNLLRVMTVVCGYNEVRLMAAQRLEMWLQNPKLTRAAQDLLMSVCMNCDEATTSDTEVMAQLSKIRLKTKPLVNQYLMSMRELLNQHAENLSILMRQTVYNELSNARNPNNMALLTAMFQHSSGQAAKILAEVFQELLCNREDYLRALRTLLREIIRSVRSDMNFAEFAAGLMQRRSDAKLKEMDSMLMDRLFHSLTDLICLTALVSISPAIKEAASAYSRGTRQDLELLHSFQTQVSTIQRDAVCWLHTTVPDMFIFKPHEFNFCLRKLLFVEKAEHYYKIDNWPPEGDRGILLRLVSEVPVMEDTLMRVMVIGLSREFGVSPPDALELCDQLVRRAAMVHAEGYEVLRVEKIRLFDAVFNLCAYKHPDNISLPKGYTPPTLAISSLYWKALSMLVIICAFNPSTFGLQAWENYPTLKCLIEMVMTNNFKFPPPTIASDETAADEVRAHERQLSELEKQQILEFEGHLAAANKVTITEQNSLLISQLMAMDPSGVARKPPVGTLDQLRMLNQSLQLGNKLCRSRNPDFLLDIIQRQGTSQSMAWLADLVETSEGSLDVLPVQCLCEFLLHDSPPDVVGDDEENTPGKMKRLQKQKKQEQLLARLQLLLHSPDSDSSAVSEVLSYFLKRLASQQTSNRQLAVKGLSMVIAKTHTQQQDDLFPEPAMEVDKHPASAVLPKYKWLLEELPPLPQFDTVCRDVCAILRQACQVETDSMAVSAYIIFLSENSRDLELQEMDELLLDMAQLVVERPTLMNHILPEDGGSSSVAANLVLAAMVDLFYCYLIKAQQQGSKEYMWASSQDQILLQWEPPEPEAAPPRATMNIRVVHAMVILLTYGAPATQSHYIELMDSWFPEGSHPPTAYLVDTQEEALLFLDWLKLRMIRSENPRLVDAALQDLEASQLLLFVQSFGIPVSSMTQLLRCLDSAVANNRVAMEDAVLDKAYMAQLVEVQHMRGAQGGEKFYRMLQQGVPPTPPVDMETDPTMRRKRTLSQLMRAPELQATHMDKEHLQEFLGKLFSSRSGPISDKERQGMFRTFMKALAKERKLWETATKAFLKLLKSLSNAAFIRGLQENETILCAILKVLIAKQSRASNPGVLSDVLAHINQHLREKSPSLAMLLKNYFAKAQGYTNSRAVTNQLVDLEQKCKSEEELIKHVSHLSEEASGGQKEALVNACMREAIKLGTTSRSTTVVTKLLQQEKLQSSTAGLLADWLSLLDPEIVSRCPSVEQHLLFFQQQTAAGGNQPTQQTAGVGNNMVAEGEAGRGWCQPYLLALLTHQGSLRSVQNCIHRLLSMDAQQQSLSASCVLDFLWACIHIPKLWRGRDKKLPKHHVPEDILQLNTDQIRVVVSLIVAEAMAADTQHLQQVSAPASELIDKRMPLLMLSFSNHGHMIREAVDYLHGKLKENNPDWGVCHHLLLQLYLRVPHILGLQSLDTSTLNDTQLTQSGISQLDQLTHRVLSTLGHAAPGKNGESQMYDANIACRKLATEHPLLLLRQLPMMAAMLGGRTMYTYSELRNGNHLTLFTHMLGLLECLQPYIFNKEYTAFPDVLKAYFDLLRFHGLHNRLLGPLFSKFVQLLYNFLSLDPTYAGRILQDYVPLLNIMSGQFPEFSVLKSLLAGLALPRREREESPPPELPADGAMLDLNSARSSNPWTPQQLAPFYQRMRKNAPIDAIIDCLKDLDETSKRKIDILDHFVGDLKRFMTHINDSVRNTAHMLVMRYIRQNPGCAGDFVEHFLQCVDSQHHEVVNSALRNLPEFIILAQEKAVVLLQKVFTIGISSKMDTSASIYEALQLLNLDNMQCFPMSENA